ncbi:hypothetical protein NC651_037197 [Populus alba x Populus x berolinensis]|nr:hypothetical protein NC651_037197 [Populus alba x Populus x berolinensis]
MLMKIRRSRGILWRTLLIMSYKLANHQFHASRKLRLRTIWLRMMPCVVQFAYKISLLDLKLLPLLALMCIILIALSSGC